MAVKGFYRTRLPKNPPTLEQALAVERAVTYRDFAFVNHWRIKLINKKFSTGDPAEWDLRFDEHPGLRERHEAQMKAALTTEEHAALDKFSRIVDDYLHRMHLAATEQAEETGHGD